MPRLFPLSLLCLLLAACPVSRGDDDDNVSDDDDNADLPELPDPGDAEDDWGLTVFPGDPPCCGTPEEAYPVGTATMNAGYIQGIFDSELAFFYVFRTDTDMEEFSFPMYFEDVHLHEGDDLRFGNLIDPSASTDTLVTWDVEPDHVYAIEVVSSFEGFF